MRIYIITAILLFTSTSVLAQQVPGAEHEDYYKALRLFDEGLFEKSADYFESFRNMYPGHPLAEEASYYFVLTRTKVHDSDLEIYVNSHVRMYPDGQRSVDLLYEMGVRAHQNDKHSDAIAWFERALEKDLDDQRGAQAYYWMAEAADQLGMTDQALDYYLILADEYPDSRWAPKALYARGRLNLVNERYDASTTAFELLRQRYPTDEMTRRVGTALGESYYLQGRYDEAITALRNALNYLEGPSESKAIFLIAESHNYLGQLDRAATFYRRYININPDPKDARIAQYGLGWVYHKQEVYHWSAEAFGKAAVGSDEFARKAQYYKAVNEKLAGRYNLAMESFQVFGDRYQEGVWVEITYYEWAVTAFEIGNHVKAIEVLLSLVRSDMALNNAGEIYTLLGEAYFANGEYTRSEQAFEQASRIVNVDPEIRRQARFQRAWVQYENQAYTSAQPNFFELYQENPNGNLAGESLFWSADSYFNAENYERAARQYREFINRYPGHEYIGAAKYALGWSYFHLNRFEDAIGPLREFMDNYEAPPIALFPYDIDVKLRLGDAYYAQRKYMEAINYYESAIGADVGGDYAIFQVANSHYRADQTFEAVRNFRRLIRNYPSSRLREQAQYNIGYIYFQTANYSQSVEEFQTVIRQFPNSEWAARAQYNIGDAYYNAGDHEKAIEEYKKVLDRYPRSQFIIEAVNGIQFAQISGGLEDQSSEVLEDFLSKHPQAGTADRLRFRQAENLLQAGDYEAAISSFRQYLRITNSTRLLADAHYNLADAYERSGKMDEAIASLNEIKNNHTRSDRYETALLDLGRLYVMQEDYSNALSAYETLRNTTTRLRREATIGMANTYLAMNDPQRALQLYRQNLERFPDDTATKLGIAKVAYQLQDYDEAEESLRTIAQKETGELGAEAQYYLGRVYQQRNQWNDAIQAFSRVGILYEAFDYWVASSYLRSSECYRALGNTTEARRLLERIIERFPNTPQAREANDILQAS